MFISEIFYTFQGEGKRLGRPSIFIRSSTCNLRCKWGNTLCDTWYTSWKPEGKGWSVQQIMDEIKQWPCKEVVITGGEPFLQNDLEPLCRRLKEEGYYITIETNGTIFKNVKVDLLSISPKLESSTPGEDTPIERKMHEERRLAWLNNFVQFDDLYGDCQVKFVVDKPEDIVEIEQLVRSASLKDRIMWLMPQGITREELLERSVWIIEECKKRGWNFTPREHINVYGNKRGV